MRKNQTKIEDILREDYSTKLNLWDGKYNKTTKFCLPMLNLNVSGKTLSKYLVNAYLEDLDLEHDIERPLFLLFSVKSFQETGWVSLQKILLDNKPYSELYVMDYYVGMKDGRNLVMYIFQVPSQWATDLETFKKSRYSLFSEEYKAKFSKEAYLSSGERINVKEIGIIHKSAEIKDFLVKEFINPETSLREEVIRFRKEIDNWPEVWDKLSMSAEVYHQKEETNDNSDKLNRTSAVSTSGTNSRT